MDTLNGGLNQLFINGEDQAAAHLPCMVLGSPGIIANISVSPAKIIFPVTIEGVVTANLDFTNVNGGLSALLNIEADSRVKITGFEIFVTETTTGTGGLNIGYTDEPTALATIADITLTAGTIVLWSDTTKVALNTTYWARSIPEGKAFTVAATGTLTAGTIAVNVRYAIVPANPNP